MEKSRLSQAAAPESAATREGLEGSRNGRHGGGKYSRKPSSRKGGSSSSPGGSEEIAAAEARAALKVAVAVQASEKAAAVPGRFGSGGG